MNIRPITTADLDALAEIDGTIHSDHYLHIEASGETPDLSWQIQRRPLRTKLAISNPICDESRLRLKLAAAGDDDSVGLCIELEVVPVALLLAIAQPETSLLEIIDVRVDFDHRRLGLGSALVYQLISLARQRSLRAVKAQTPANNHPANSFMQKLGFELTGLDTHRISNHDLVKETVTLFWYAVLG